MPPIKRLCDIIFSILGLVLLSPVLLAIALLVDIFIGRPIIFRQKRGGYKGRHFLIYKFRTMTDRRAPDGSLLPDAERLTPLGRFLRSSSLDELPEFLGVDTSVGQNSSGHGDH